MLVNKALVSVNKRVQPRPALCEKCLQITSVVIWHYINKTDLTTSLPLHLSQGHMILCNSPLLLENVTVTDLYASNVRGKRSEIEFVHWTVNLKVYLLPEGKCGCGFVHMADSFSTDWDTVVLINLYLCLSLLTLSSMISSVTMFFICTTQTLLDILIDYLAH